MSSKRTRGSQGNRFRGRRIQSSQERFNPLSRPRQSTTQGTSGTPLTRSFNPAHRDVFDDDHHQQLFANPSIILRQLPALYASDLESSYPASTSLELQTSTSAYVFGSSQSEVPAFTFDFTFPVTAFSDDITESSLPSTDLVSHHSGSLHPQLTSGSQRHSSVTESIESMYSIASNPYSVNLPTSHQFIDASVDASLSQPRAFLSSGAMYPQSNRPGGFPHTPQWPASYQRPPTQQYYGQQTPDRREETVPASSAAPSSYTSIAPQAPVYPGGSYPLGVYNATSQPYYQQNPHHFNQTGYDFSPSTFVQPTSYPTSTSADARVPLAPQTYLPTNSSGGTPEPESQVRVIESRPKPQCWDHGCNGREFSTFSNLLRHQRERSGAAAKSECPHCGAVFTRTTARNTHIAQGKCKGIREASV